MIQPLEASVVKAIHVKNGDLVKAGQTLVELDATMAQADHRRVGDERAAAVSEALRTQALLEAWRRDFRLKTPELSTGADSLPEGSAMMQMLSDVDRRLAETQLLAEWQDIQAQRDKLEADVAMRQAELNTVREQIAKLQATLPIAKKREDDFLALQAQGFVSQHAGQDRTQLRIEMERDLATQQARLREVQAAIGQAQHSLTAWKTETLRSLNERHAQADLQARALSAESQKTGQREKLTTLTAPVAGTVQQLAVHTTSGVVTPAQVLMVVVPHEAQVTAEVNLENKDVGFVREGQIVEIKLDTFPFTRYGTVPGRVKTVSADAVTDEKRGAIFPATVVLDRSVIDVEGKQIRLAPGMTLAAEIKTGKRRVIDYLLSPVQQHTHESLRER